MKSKNLQYAFYVEYYKELPAIIRKREANSHSERDEEKDWEAKKYKQLNRDILRIAWDTDGSMKKLDKCDGALSVFYLQSSYPGILIGTGHEHGVKGKGEIGMGFTFDYVTGLPYLPGSSLKGILRFGFKQEDYIQEVIKDVLHIELSAGEIRELEGKIFEGESAKDRFIFYDAIIGNNRGGMPLLALDTIAPHTKDGLKEPNPITFLRICPGVILHFVFRLHAIRLSEGKCIHRRDILIIFKCILEDLGIGAKTNLGYGVLE